MSTPALPNGPPSVVKDSWPDGTLVGGFCANDATARNRTANAIVNNFMVSPSSGFVIRAFSVQPDDGDDSSLDARDEIRLDARPRSDGANLLPVCPLLNDVPQHSEQTCTEGHDDCLNVVRQTVPKCNDTSPHIILPALKLLRQCRLPALVVLLRLLTRGLARCTTPSERRG